MNKSATLFAFVVAVATAPAVAQEPRQQRETVPEARPRETVAEGRSQEERGEDVRCGLFVKWVGLHLSDDRRNLPVAPGSLEVTLIEFWSGPYGSSDEVKDATAHLALQGGFGSLIVDGWHNTASAREYFSPARIIKTEYEFDCRR